MKWLKMQRACIAKLFVSTIYVFAALKVYVLAKQITEVK
jgi:hypothetical protein